MAYETDKQYAKSRARDEDRTVHVENRTGGAATGVMVALGIAAVIVLGMVFIDWGGGAGDTTVIQDDPDAVIVEPSGGEGTAAPMQETAPAAESPGETTAPASEETAPATDETAPPADQ